MKTDSYAAVQGSTEFDGCFTRLVRGVVMARGNHKAMAKKIRAEGGSRSGWFLYLTNIPLGSEVNR